jgi:hypothetical protein
MPNLTKQEAELIAALPTDPGYLLIMDKLQAAVDDVTERLYAAPTHAQAVEILPYWKALRTLVFELKYAPVNMMEYLDSIRSNQHSTIEPDVNAKNQLDTFINNFSKMREGFAEDMSRDYDALNTAFKEPDSPGNWL